MTGAAQPDRRGVAAGLGALALAAAVAGPAHAQLAGLEVVASGQPGDGEDQLARAIAEGLALTKLTPRAMALNAPRDVNALNDFLAGKRPRAALMIVGLSTVGVLQTAGAADRLGLSRPLCRVLGEQLPIVVPAGSKIRDLPSLMDAIRKDAASVTWAGRAKGSADHLLCLRLTKAAGGDVSRIAYTALPNSAAASNHLLKGGVAVGTGALIEFIAQIRGGTLRPLGIASSTRIEGLDIPTLQEQGVDVALLNWRGVLTRDAVGSSLIERYGEAIARVLKTPGWGELMRQRFWTDLYQPQAEFTTFLAQERLRVAAILKEAGWR